MLDKKQSDQIRKIFRALTRLGFGCRQDRMKPLLHLFYAAKTQDKSDAYFQMMPERGERRKRL